MSDEDTKPLRVGIESIRILRKLKARLTIEFDEDVTYQDALNFAICQRVLDSETIISFIEAYILAEETKRLRFEGRKKKGFGDAIYELIRALRSSKADRDGVLDSIENELRVAEEKELVSGIGEVEDIRRRFLDSSEEIAEVPENALTQVWLEKPEEGEPDASKREGEDQNESE